MKMKYPKEIYLDGYTYTQENSYKRNLDALN